jgi:hypothetical protein
MPSAKEVTLFPCCAFCDSNLQDHGIGLFIANWLFIMCWLRNASSVSNAGPFACTRLSNIPPGHASAKCAHHSAT